MTENDKAAGAASLCNNRATLVIGCHLPAGHDGDHDEWWMVGERASPEAPDGADIASAAAPDLYEALRDLVAAVNRPDLPQERAARAALAKAEQRRLFRDDTNECEHGYCPPERCPNGCAGNATPKAEP